MFEVSARNEWHLGHENVAAMLLEAGEPRKAVGQLRAAVRLQPSQSFGWPADRARFNNATQAEYSNLLAVAFFRSGMPKLALGSALDSVKRRREIPEANYNLGMLLLIHSLSLEDDVTKSRELAENASRQFEIAWSLDPAFREALEMEGVALALLDECDLARSAFERSDAVPPDSLRLFPFATGTGDMHTAGIHRRLRILDVPEPLEADFQRRRCAADPE